MNKNRLIATALETIARLTRQLTYLASLIEPEVDVIHDKPTSTSPKFTNADGDWKEEMTAAINKGNSEMVAAVVAVAKSKLPHTVNKPVLPPSYFIFKKQSTTTEEHTAALPLTLVGMTILAVSELVKIKLIRQNYKSQYYKIEAGCSCGAVIRVNKKTNKVEFDGRYITSKFNHSSSHIATVTYDQDGKDYVNRVIRGQLNVGKNRVKLVRMYRPKGHAGHYSHCDIYQF